MILKVTIGTIDAGDVGKELVDDLLRISPGSRFATGSFLLGNRTEDDPLVVKVLERLKQAGMEPKPRGGGYDYDRKRYYMFVRHRLYERHELEQFELLAMQEMIGGTRLATCRRTTLGYVAVDYEAVCRGELLSHGPAVAAAHPEGQSTTKLAFQIEGYFVPQHVKELLGRSGLKCIAFKPTVLRESDQNFAPSHAWSEVDTEPWWELTADVHMPPLGLNTELVYWRDSQPLTERDRRGERWNDGVLPIEGFYARPQLRYRRKDIQSHMGTGWDVARMYEPFGHRVWDYHPLICSQRFYRFCVEQGVEAEWVPVHIEE